MDFAKVHQLQSNIEKLEIDETKVNESSQLFTNEGGASNKNMKTMLAKVKITREVYGMSCMAEPLNVYYVTFAETTEEEKMMLKSFPPGAFSLTNLNNFNQRVKSGGNFSDMTNNMDGPSMSMQSVDNFEPNAGLKSEKLGTKRGKKNAG